MKILLAHTGGTIGSSNSDEKLRVQSAKSVSVTKKYLVEAFERSNSKYFDKVKIVDSNFPGYQTTLSESMTLDKVSDIIGHINGKLKEDDYSGIIILHGTDSLAYASALFALMFANIKIPVFIVSGNLPPQEENSNATSNFVWAIDLICQGIAPNVYVTYRNADDIDRLYIASCIMQSVNFSDDFESASKNKVFELNSGSVSQVMNSCKVLSDARRQSSLVDIEKFCRFSDNVLLIHPYLGLDYSLYNHAFEGEDKKYKGIVHGTYHSGTVCLPGLVLLAEARKIREDKGDETTAKEFEELAKSQLNSANSIYYLDGLCKQKNIPLYIAPSTLCEGQYETMSVVNSNTSATLLNMTTEFALAKLIVAITFNMTDEEIDEYMKTPVCGEFID